jgi:hypothetical protein
VKFLGTLLILLWATLLGAVPMVQNGVSLDHTATALESEYSVESLAFEQRQLVESAKTSLEFTADLQGIDGCPEIPHGISLQRTGTKSTASHQWTSCIENAHSAVLSNSFSNPIERALCTKRPPLYPNVKIFLSLRCIRI